MTNLNNPFINDVGDGWQGAHQILQWLNPPTEKGRTMIDCTSTEFDSFLFICPNFADRYDLMSKTNQFQILDAISALAEDCMNYIISIYDGSLVDYISDEPTRSILGTFLRGEGDGILVRVGMTVDVYCIFCIFSKKLQIVDAKVKNLN